MQPRFDRLSLAMSEEAAALRHVEDLSSACHPDECVGIAIPILTCHAAGVRRSGAPKGRRSILPRYRTDAGRPERSSRFLVPPPLTVPLEAAWVAGEEPFRLIEVHSENPRDLDCIQEPAPV